MHIVLEAGHRFFFKNQEVDDPAFLTGVFAAGNCPGQGQYDLWTVNENAEYREEISPQDRIGRLQPESLPVTSELLV